MRSWIARRRAGTAQPPASLILDTYSAAAAFSTRKLRTAYAGSAIRVRRSSDNVEQDIGFSGNALDTTALSSFIGANSGFVVTWYDQSGNGRDITQTTTAAQPRIVNAGIIDTVNFLPSVFFGSAFRLRRAGFLWGAGSMTAFFMTQADLAAERCLFAENNTASANAIYRFTSQATTGHLQTFIRNDANTSILGTTLVNNAFAASLRQITVRDNATQLAGWQHLTAGTPAAYTRSTLTANDFHLGADVRAGAPSVTYNNGYISEAIFSTSALSDTDREAIANNQVAAFPP